MKEYDVIIVGGGIHGAGVLQAAVAAGHTALLIERFGLASGTSSRSSKLIHGGLRYLESGQFALVRESLRERAIHLRIAAALVELKPFFIPVYRDTRRRPWQLKLGLWVYALLGGFDAATAGLAALVFEGGSRPSLLALSAVVCAWHEEWDAFSPAERRDQILALEHRRARQGRRMASRRQAPPRPDDQSWKSPA